MNSIRVEEILKTMEIRLKVSKLPGHQPVFGLEETVRGLRSLHPDDVVSSFPVAGEDEYAFALVDEANRRVVGVIIPAADVSALS